MNFQHFNGSQEYIPHDIERSMQSPTDKGQKDKQ
jgi:hypothetical protein